MLITPIAVLPRTTGAAMAVIPGVNTSSIMLKPRERAACTNLSNASTVVGALGPKSAGAPNPWRATNCSASSSLIVSSHA
jgi:hypothetical protein